MSTAGRHEQLMRLRAAGARRIVDLGLTTYPDIDALCRHVSELRERPIVLVPVKLRASDPCGMWVVGRNEDLVFYDMDTTGAHQEHIIMHELGHIISCHRGSGLLDDASARLLFPNLDPALVRDMLMRATYDDVQEQEAEVIAYLLSQRILPHHGPAERAPDSALDRIARILG
ncbi:hypothetical protein [Krasilnikovia sp. M28-CT-15]|uniref:hypothetical protein n=1 Tax=Krasilnikovia sp. M28-CT-15 TaxID=3373540 RepID=UPI003876D15E